MKSQQQSTVSHRKNLVPVTSGSALNHLTTLADKGSLPRLITVSGGTCSGKSTFAHQISQRLMALRLSVSLLELDAYFRNADDPVLPIGTGGSIFDSPLAFHRNEFAADVADLLKGNLVDIPIYDMLTNHRTEGTRWVFPADFIIVEGIFAASFLDHSGLEVFHVYMETSTVVCLARRISRDVVAYNITESRVTDEFRSNILPLWSLHQQSEKTIAHLIVDDTERNNSHGQ